MKYFLLSIHSHTFASQAVSGPRLFPKSILSYSGGIGDYVFWEGKSNIREIHVQCFAMFSDNSGMNSEDYVP